MKKVTEQQLQDFLEEHLPYEVDMLRGTFELLQNETSHARAYALMESFCIHGRNLIEFFKNKDSCDFDPRKIAKDGYELRKTFIDSSHLERINEQISHLTRKRTRTAAEKIGPSTRKLILDRVEDELERLKRGLNQKYIPMWRVAPRPTIQVNSAAPSASGQLSHTSLIIHSPIVELKGGQLSPIGRPADSPERNK